jgi:predicted secreted hydrolase
VRRRAGALAAAVAGTLLTLGSACRERAAGPTARLSLLSTLGGVDTAGYLRALEPRSFSFPDDHGPHPGYRTEWWYVTGNLDTAEGRAVGFQLTFFRSALAPPGPTRASAWGTRQAYMAHFAVTDERGERFYAFERFERGALGLAGARARPFRVWLDDWSLEAAEPAGDAVVFPLRLRAGEGEVALDLVLAAGKPPVAHGDRGLSRKGSRPGNASYYYSKTRMPARGVVRIGADTLHAAGLAWLDREWSTSSLAPGDVGWDWIALQLDGGWEVMLYRLRRADGSTSPFSRGTLVDPDGRVTPLVVGEDVRVEATGSWRGPDGATYPSGWRVHLPGQGWDLSVRPLLADQELTGAFRYWEGAVRVAPAAGGEGPGGRGYVELTGYAGEPPGG